MAYVNVKEWSPDQVTEWLRGLDNVILPYINSFLNNEVKGHQLLCLRSDDLEHLGVYTLGHQELILEAVEQLRNFHYELDRENLQLLALRLSCASRSLYNELLSAEDENEIKTQAMADVANIISTIKPLVCWLDRNPFSGQMQYLDRQSKLLQLSLEMATCAQRDRFAEQPVDKIRTICFSLSELADNIIQEISDPMLLQPASLDLATLKKKENELGFSLMPSFHGIHQIAEIKFSSPAHTNSKLEEGDEIVQVNYQTVVGWQRKKVLGLFQESPPDIVLTLKKRPRHTKVYGQIYMKPYRLPSKKRATPYSRWNDNLPSPRPELLTIPDFELPLPRLPPVTKAQPLESESSSDSEPPDSPLESQGRVYPLKPRPVLQRRNTITGASPTSKRPLQAIEELWNELKHQAAFKHSSSTYIETDVYKNDSVYLRDKSASCGHGLELTRPATYPKKFDKTLLISDKSDSKVDGKKRVNFEERKVIFEEFATGDSKSEVKSSSSTERKRSGENNKNIVEVKTSTSEIRSTIIKESCTTTTSINLNYTGLYEQNLEKSISVNSLSSLSQCEEPIKFIDETVDEMYDRSHMNAEWKHEIIEEIIGRLEKSRLNLSTCVNNTTPTNSPEKNTEKSIEMLQIIEIDKSIPINPVEPVKPIALPRQVIQELPRLVKKPPEIPAKPDILKKPAVPPRNFTTRITRGRLDKSQSTPAYDTTQENPDKPPLEVCKNPEILITGPEYHEISSKPTDNTLFGTKTIETTTPVVETINTALHDLRNPYEGIKLTSDGYQHIPDLSPIPEPLVHHKLEESRIIHSNPPCEVDAPKYGIKMSETPPEPPPRTIYNHADTPMKMKHFEPKSISTPITKTSGIEFPSVESHRTVTDGPIRSTETKISPTNSVVRVIMSKNKSGKKKNTLLAKRRKVSVKDLQPCDMQGFLYQRLRNKQSQNIHWEKRWFVLLGSCLYGFKTKDSSKAECLIFLTGFTVAVAHEVKSRLNAFKVYHTGTAFYFSADNSESMTSWVEMITAATLHSDGSKSSDHALYSDTDDSESEKPKAESKEKSESSRFGSLKKFTSSKKSSNSDSAHHSESTSLDRKYLRFFNNSASKPPKNQLPVPTPQYRSYRKVVPPNLVVTQPVKKPEVAPKSPEIHVTASSNLHLDTQQIKPSDTSSNSQKSNKLKPKPINYIHASNPSLCDINDYRLPAFYQRTRQFTQRTENLAGFVTLEQFMLNRQEEERKQNLLYGAANNDVQINPNSIQPDVVYGEVRMPYSPSGDSRTFDNSKSKKDLSGLRKNSDTKGNRLTHTRTNSDGYTDLYYDKQHRKYSTPEDGIPFSPQGQSKTLPKTEKSIFEMQTELVSSTELVSDIKISEPYELQFADKKSLRPQKMSAESSRFQDRSYEMIYCPQKVNDVQFAQNRTLDPQNQKKYPELSKKASKLMRQHSLNSADKKDSSSKIFTRGDSPEKFWLDSLRRSDKIFDKNTAKVKLKSATQYTPMCLPLTPDQRGKLNPKFAFELNLDEKSSSGKSSGGKFKNFFGSHKSSDEKKEKTLLGSPRLHRALFRKPNPPDPSDWSSEAPHVVPYSTNLPPPIPRTGLSSSTNNHLIIHSNTLRSSSSINSPPPDYPGLEYPPVFEPETYSLANPSCSLTLLRKQQQK